MLTSGHLLLVDEQLLLDRVEIRQDHERGRVHDQDQPRTEVAPGRRPDPCLEVLVLGLDERAAEVQVALALEPLLD
jgi:hypothetical protein